MYDEQAERVEECCCLLAECLQDASAVFPPAIRFQIPLRVKISTGPTLASLTPSSPAPPTT